MKAIFRILFKSDQIKLSELIVYIMLKRKFNKIKFNRQMEKKNLTEPKENTKQTRSQHSTGENSEKKNANNLDLTSMSKGTSIRNPSTSENLGEKQKKNDGLLDTSSLTKPSSIKSSTNADNINEKSKKKDGQLDVSSLSKPSSIRSSSNHENNNEEQKTNSHSEKSNGNQTARNSTTVASISGSQNAMQQFNNKIMEFKDNSLASSSSQSSVSIAADICFLIDGTGSMQPWIDSVKTKISKMIELVTEKYPGAKFRVGYVVYRDFDMKEKSMEICDFTNKYSEVESKLKEVIATGGADGPEDINGGMQVLLTKMAWKSTNAKIIIHFADAPCHGRDFHNFSDSHPNPESDKPWDKILKTLKKNGIDYNFMEIQDKSTRKMTNYFEKIWNDPSLSTRKSEEQRAGEFKVYPVDSDYNDLFSKIVVSVHESIRKTVKHLTESKKNL